MPAWTGISNKACEASVLDMFQLIFSLQLDLQLTSWFSAYKGCSMTEAYPGENEIGGALICLSAQDSDLLPQSLLEAFSLTQLPLLPAPHTAMSAP